MYPAMVKQTSADSKVSSKVSISQAAFSNSALNLSGANDDFKISIVSKLIYTMEFLEAALYWLITSMPMLC